MNIGVYNEVHNKYIISIEVEGIFSYSCPPIIISYLHYNQEVKCVTLSGIIRPWIKDYRLNTSHFESERVDNINKSVKSLSNETQFLNSITTITHPS